MVRCGRQQACGQLANFITMALHPEAGQVRVTQYALVPFLPLHHIQALEAILVRHPVFH